MDQPLVRSATGSPVLFRVLFVLVGTMVRAWFGWSHQLWNAAPDQGAWHLALADVATHGLPAFRHLVHYPHEGGTLLISLLALLVGGYTCCMPPLSWVALGLDALVRYVQIHWAGRLFGPRAAMAFGLWTILAVPLMLPWATVNFGLHALMSFAPFVVVVMLKDQRPAFALGSVLGVLACLAYDVLVLVPVCVYWSLVEQRARRRWDLPLFFAGLVVGFMPHVLLRLFVDHGFGLERWAPLSVRGMELESLDPVDIPARYWAILTDVIPGAFTLDPVERTSTRVISWLITLVCVIGVIVSLRRTGRVARAAVLCVLFFALAMAFIPLFTPSPQGHGIIYYRYIPFIAPFLVLLMLDGFSHSWKWRRIPVIGVLVGSAMLSVTYMQRKPVAHVPNHKAIGWVLARKYGHEPERLISMASLLDGESRSDFLFGCGWGTAAAWFDHRTAGDTVGIMRFHELVNGYPEEARDRVRLGAAFAFDPGLTPRLDARLGQELQEDPQLGR